MKFISPFSHSSFFTHVLTKFIFELLHPKSININFANGKDAAYPDYRVKVIKNIIYNKHFNRANLFHYIRIIKSSLKK